MHGQALYSAHIFYLKGVQWKAIFSSPNDDVTVN